MLISRVSIESLIDIKAFQLIDGRGTSDGSATATHSNRSRYTHVRGDLEFGQERERITDSVAFNGNLSMIANCFAENCHELCINVFFGY